MRPLSGDPHCDVGFSDTQPASVNSDVDPLTRTTEKLCPHGYRVDQLGHWPLDPGLTVFLHDILLRVKIGAGI